MSSSPVGVLLVNLGTPDAPTTPAVRRYLREFLSDPRVIDIPAPARFLLLNLIILPFRSPKSAHAYAQVWTPEGSPLSVHGQRLTQAIQSSLGDRFRVELAMRYGNPSVAAAWDRMRKASIDRVVVVPLYPQYASATTGSSLEHVMDELTRGVNVPSVSVVPPFFDDEAVVQAWAESGIDTIRDWKPDHVLFSFHGLPERQVRKSDPSGAHCLASGTCCERGAPPYCYRSQCVSTAKRIADALRLSPERWTVTFQSRLGRDKWLDPATDTTLQSLKEKGVRRVLVWTPAFVADCLETLEEIGMRSKEAFEAGGEDRELRVVPCLNTREDWVAALSDLILRNVPGGGTRVVPLRTGRQ